MALLVLHHGPPLRRRAETPENKTASLPSSAPACSLHSPARRCTPSTPDRSRTHGSLPPLVPSSSCVERQTSEDLRTPAYPDPNACPPVRSPAIGCAPRAARSADRALRHRAPMLHFHPCPANGIHRTPT